MTTTPISCLVSNRAARLERLAVRYARIALGAAFVAAVASRLGLVGGGDFAAFERYAAQVNSFMPAVTHALLARAATVLEACLGLALILGVWPRWVALGAAILLALFGTAMAISFGIDSPLEYSVFSASACALLLATRS
jgi:putative oxidoreductase